MKPKFKAGDIVMCVATHYSNIGDQKSPTSFTKGKAYRVLRMEEHIPQFQEGKWYSVILIDDNGILNGWNERYFDVFPDELGHLARLLAG